MKKLKLCLRLSLPIILALSTLLIATSTSEIILSDKNSTEGAIPDQSPTEGAIPDQLPTEGAIPELFNLGGH